VTPLEQRAVILIWTSSWLQRTEKDEFLPEARPALCKAQSHLLAVPGYEQPELMVGPEKEATVAIKSFTVKSLKPDCGRLLQ
jgi:hypothetical protein